MSMDELRARLTFLTDWIPPDIREIAPDEAWWFLYVVALLAILLVIGTVLRSTGRLFARKKKERDWDAGWRETLEECPLPAQPKSERRLAVYHVPVWIRLVIVAPMSKDQDLDQATLPELLNRVFPMLGTIVEQDTPRVRIWPQQLSPIGFNSAFHRRTLKPEQDGELSRWVLIAGRVVVGKQTLLLGLGLWAEEPCALGRLNLEPMQWLEILRLRGA
jgi:hypothetical protein